MASLEAEIGVDGNKQCIEPPAPSRLETATILDRNGLTATQIVPNWGEDLFLGVDMQGRG